MCVCPQFDVKWPDGRRKPRNMQPIGVYALYLDVGRYCNCLSWPESVTARHSCADGWPAVLCVLLSSNREGGNHACLLNVVPAAGFRSVLMLATYSHQAKPGLPHRGLLRVRFDAPSE